MPGRQPAPVGLALAVCALIGCSSSLDYDNPLLEQSLHAGTWTDDSQAFYFAKYVQIKIPPEGRPSAWNLPKTVYGELQIYRHDVARTRTTLVKSLDFRYGGYPVDIRFRDALLEGELCFETVTEQLCLDLRSLDLRRAKRPVEEDPRVAAHFVRRKDRVFADADTRHAPVRYLSPDRSAFLELHPDRIGAFRDPSADLKTWAELGWGGGIPPEGILRSVRRFQPQRFVAVEDLQSAKESAARTKYGIR
jgi:hypothetical protein